MRYGFHNISGHQHLEAKQERATDADFVDFGILLGYPLPQLAKSGRERRRSRSRYRRPGSRDPLPAQVC
jgi:hypothetical protein